MRRRIVLTGLALLIPGVATAALDTSLGYRSWRVDLGAGKTTVSQFLVPVSAAFPLGSSAWIVVTDAAASSALDLESQSRSSLSGTSPLISQAYWRVDQGHVLLQAGLTAPSGKRELSDEEFAVLRVIGLPVLGFPLRQYGRGGEYNAGVSYGTALGSTAVGSVGAGFTARGSYTLRAGEPDYKPASEWAVTAGLDAGARTDMPGAAPMRVDLTFRSFGKDESGGEPVFEEGDQLELHMQGGSSGPGMRVAGQLRLILKSSNKEIGGDSSSVSEIKRSSGNGVFARAGVGWPFGTAIRAGLELEWDQVSGSDTFGRDGMAFGVGPGLTYDAGAVAVRLQALGLRGSLDGGASGDMDITGYSVGGALRWSWGR